MIIDNIKNCEKYFSVNKNFKKAFEFIEKAIKENYVVGKYEIAGDDIFAYVQEYVTKNESECKYEGHRKYIDIQFIVLGVEAISVTNISKITPSTEYDEEKDILHFDKYDKSTTAVINVGEYGIFFPYDIHKPGMSLGENNIKVKKIVVKVKV